MLYVTSQRFGESSVSLCNSVLRDMIDSLQVVEVYNFLARWFFLQFSASKVFVKSFSLKTENDCFGI
ncbi:unnamed protein product [Trifolium pratense]|uniref:Uncharacterized protein n=2 Tax=Trifolium pratense TaxID=57577 RepID=A0ACB0LZI8_TRIPR|nr:unnamed protein product [Trifolium pratense]CAJ2674713.1 unnamed protein product [Trifolium pratense]